MEYILSPAGRLKAQWRILLALMLRDIKTRFFGSAFGFLLAVLWPLSHILILLLMNVFLGRVVPYGDSAALWFATGLVPFMVFSYMSRFTMMGVALNRSLLNLPIVKVTDILFARALLECLNASAVAGIVMALFIAFGIDITPHDVPQACAAFLAAMLLGLSFGVINGIIAALSPTWITGYALLTIILWIASGVFFVPDALPAAVREPLSFNPILQGVEWMRAAYYEGYGTTVLDKSYMLYFALATLFLGLALERLMRGKMLQG